MKKGIEIGKRHKIKPIEKMVGPLAPKSNRVGGPGVAVEAVTVIAFLSLVLGALIGMYGQELVALAGPLRRFVGESSLIGSVVKQ